MSKQRDRYNKYLRSKEWSKLRLDLIQTRGAKCERCGVTRNQFRYLHIHHLTYERLFNEDPKDLEILCAPCHREEHGITKKRKRDKPKIKVTQKVNKKKKFKFRKPVKTETDLRWEAMRAKFGFGKI